MEWGASAVGGTRSADHLTSATPEDSTPLSWWDA